MVDQSAMEQIMNPAGVCKHGAMKAKCLACELEEEVKKWKRECIKWQDTNTEVEEENAILKARLQVMWTWMGYLSDTPRSANQMFIDSYPEAADWFDEDGVPR